MKDDPYDLRRFVEAQAPAFDAVVAELAAGAKRTHWMWFVFPQIAGLGSSPMAVRYAIGSLAEARAYLGHMVLGPRLRHTTELVNAIEGQSAHQVFGTPDDMKFRSCMTLFANASSGGGWPFEAALAKYFEGRPDPATTRLLELPDHVNFRV